MLRRVAAPWHPLRSIQAAIMSGSVEVVRHTIGCERLRARVRFRHVDPCRHGAHPEPALYPTHRRAFSKRRNQGPSSCGQSRGSQEYCRRRKQRSGWGIRIVTRPSALVRPSRWGSGDRCPWAGRGDRRNGSSRDHARVPPRRRADRRAARPSPWATTMGSFDPINTCPSAAPLRSALRMPWTSSPVSHSTGACRYACKAAWGSAPASCLTAATQERKSL